jgi:hypothetical protein
VKKRKNVVEFRGDVGAANYDLTLEPFSQEKEKRKKNRLSPPKNEQFSQEMH